MLVDKHWRIFSFWHEEKLSKYFTTKYKASPSLPLGHDKAHWTNNGSFNYIEMY